MDDKQPRQSAGGIMVHRYYVGPALYMIRYSLTEDRFLVQFTGVIQYIRSIVRPGVMFYIRDPTDPAHHPVKEAMERPWTTQFNKVGLLPHTVCVIERADACSCSGRC